MTTDRRSYPSSASETEETERPAGAGRDREPMTTNDTVEADLIDLTTATLTDLAAIADEDLADPGRSAAGRGRQPKEQHRRIQLVNPSRTVQPE